MKKNNEGFSMIEALVAIFILVWAIVAVSGLLQGGFKSFAETRDQITMDFLTQEGMEVIRSVRDSNIRAKRDWDHGLDICIGGVCKVSMSDSLKIEECSGGGCELLRHNKETGQFGYNSDWEQSDFTRKIWIDNEDDNKATIHVLVEKSPTQKIEMKESLYDLALKDDPEEEDSGPVTITYFIPNPYKIYEGQESILYWSAKNATSCSGDSFETKGNTGGSVAVTPIATTKYTLTCDGTDGPVTVDTTVTVDNNAPLPKADFYASPSISIDGSTATLYWDSENAISCSGDSFDTDDNPDGSVTVNPTKTTPYTLTCEGLGGTVIKETTVTAQDEPFKTCGDGLLYEGHVYETVEIGGQCWFAENLRYDNGCSENEWNSSSPPYNACDNDGYHALSYQWEAAMDGSTNEGAQGLCPSGWHIPTDEQWKMLGGAVDSEYNYPNDEWDKTEWMGSDVGDNLKDEDVINWYSSNPGWRSGFNAIPAGFYTREGTLVNVNFSGLFWSSSPGGLNNPWRWRLGQDYSEVSRGRFTDGKAYGYSVRCVLD